MNSADKTVNFLAMESKSSSFSQEEPSQSFNDPLKTNNSIFNIEDQCTLLSARRIKDSQPLFRAFENENINAIQEYVYMVEEKLERTQKSYIRKLNSLMNRMQIENEREDKYVNEVNLLKKQLEYNKKVIRDLEHNVNQSKKDKFQEGVTKNSERPANRKRTLRLKLP